MKTPILFVGAVLAVPLTAQGWSLRSTSGPPARFGAAMAYDLSRQVTVLFGGFDGTAAMLADTWAWDGNAWSQRIAANSPSARTESAMAFDLASGRMILFSGCPWTQDTWAFDGTTWAQLQPTRQPQARSRSAMSWLPQRNSLLLFGGETGSSARLNDTWEWVGNDWVQRFPANSPTARSGHWMSADWIRERILIANGASGVLLADVWEFDGLDWARSNAVNSPPPAFQTAGVYDVNRAMHVTFGGSLGNFEISATTRVFDGQQWGVDPDRARPTARRSAAMAYDFARGRTVLFGGHDNDAPAVGDTWEYDGGSAAAWTDIGAGCAGSAGEPVLSPAFGVRAVRGRVWFPGVTGAADGVAALVLGAPLSTWNGRSLPVDLAFLGMPGCSLRAAPDTVLVQSVSAGSTAWQIMIPDVPVLIGQQLRLQALVLDPGANALGVAATNGALVRIGAF
jgi:hypothetical protein